MPAPTWSPSQERQSFRSWLLQHGFPLGSPVPPANLLQCGLLSPRGHKSNQDSAPDSIRHTDSMGSQTPSGIHLLWCEVLHGLRRHLCYTTDLHGLQESVLPHHGLQHGAAGSLCFGTWSTSCPSFCIDLSVCRADSLVYSHSSLLWLQLLLLSNFFPFLNKLSQSCCYCLWWAHPWPVASLPWRKLALALSDRGEASGSFSLKSVL